MRRTKSGLPKHCSWNLDRENGKRRVRFRKGGFAVYLIGTPWSENFMRQYAAAVDGMKAQPSNIGMERTKSGTVNSLIVSYYTLVFPLLKPSTQRMRRNILERFRRDHGDKPVARLEHAHIASIIAAKANTPEAANNLRKVLRHLLDHGVALRMITANPVIGTKRFKTSGEESIRGPRPRSSNLRRVIRSARKPIWRWRWRSVPDSGSAMSSVWAGSMCAATRSRCGKKRRTRRC
jgi:hypothetical protein